ncbi:Protein of unknown function, partial [Gryllus bimaculatus]
VVDSICPQLQARPESLSRARWLLLLASPADAGWDAVAALAPPVDCEFLVAAPWPAAAPPAAVACRAEPPPRTLLSAGAHRGSTARWRVSESTWQRRLRQVVAVGGVGGAGRGTSALLPPLGLVGGGRPAPAFRVAVGATPGPQRRSPARCCQGVLTVTAPTREARFPGNTSARRLLWSYVVDVRKGSEFHRAEADAALSGYDALPERAAAVDFSQPLVISK